MLLAVAPCLAGEPVRLTNDGRPKQDLVFPVGGESLVYSVYETQTQISMMRLKLADRTIERVNPAVNLSQFEPAYSRDGRYAAWVQSRGNLNLTMIIKDLKESKEATFDPGGGFAGMRHPAFAPDGSRIVFSLPGVGGQQLVSVNLAGQDRKDLTAWEGLTNWPSYSPDGKRLVFGSSRDGDFEIYSSGSDGSDLRRLTTSAGRDLRPRFSPDGKRIAFTSARDGNPEIYVMNADGSGILRVTNHPDRDDYAAWQTDSRLAIVSERSGQSDVYLVDVP